MRDMMRTQTAAEANDAAAPRAAPLDKLAVLPWLPLLAYSRWAGAPLGRRWIGSRISKHLPPRGRFLHRHPNGAALELDLADELGRYAYVYGAFEPAELRALLDCTAPGSAAFDVGANVGYHTTALAQHLQDGLVVAVEPSPANLLRLQENLVRHPSARVRVHACAAGAAAGHITLNLASDPAYLSTLVPVGNRATGEALDVPLRTLDDIWEEEGRPRVSVIKIDVEGAEPSVLAGARMLLATHRPALLLEANEAGQLEVLERALRPLGYRSHQPPGFERWNHLFCVNAERGVH